jgi:hypothetical protein
MISAPDFFLDEFAQAGSDSLVKEDAVGAESLVV